MVKTPPGAFAVIVPWNPVGPTASNVAKPLVPVLVRLTVWPNNAAVATIPAGVAAVVEPIVICSPLIGVSSWPKPGTVAISSEPDKSTVPALMITEAPVVGEALPVTQLAAANQSPPIPPFQV